MNRFEVKLVSTAQPFYAVVTLQPMGGRKMPNRLKLKAMKGNVVNLRMPLEETIEHVLKTADAPEPLVMDPARALAIYAYITNRQGVTWRNFVDMDKVLAALEWLVKYNPLWKNVKIDRDALRKVDLSSVVKLADAGNPAFIDPNLEAEAPEEDERKRYDTFLVRQSGEEALDDFLVLPHETFTDSLEDS